MEIEEHYSQLLGIRVPWEISKVDLDVSAHPVGIEIEYTGVTGACPECGANCPKHDDRKQRSWRHLAKHLPAHGWQPTVICVDPRHHIERLDPDLADQTPRDLEIIRASAISVKYTRPFEIAGDIGLRGYLHLRALARQLAQRCADAVLITASSYYPILLAGWIRRRWGVPVVLDFQDPWVSSAGARAVFGSKAGTALPQSGPLLQVLFRNLPDCLTKIHGLNGRFKCTSSAPTINRTIQQLTGSG